tara:strand:- start:2451 stop:3986 length:1536 start_codon:yes stop_codon:yes gene_type:complete
LDTVAAEDKRPDVVIAVNTLPRTLEPSEITGNIEVRVFYSLFDTLIRRDFINQIPGEAPKLMPSLAKSWRRIDDRTLEVTIRPGVKFHNGDILSADDVVFTFSKERLWGKKSLSRRGRNHFGMLKEVSKIDAHTVRFTTKHPDPLLEQKLTGYTAWVVNARSWLKYKSDKPDWLKIALDANRWNPVGTGPLKFNQREPGKEISFIAHDAYFMGKQNFGTLTFKEVPDRVGRMAGLIGGKFDIIVDIAPERIGVLDKYPNIEARSVLLDNSHVLAFNTNSSKLRDKRLRQALSLAIDRKALRKTLWLNRNFTPNGHQLESFGKMYNAKRPGYVYDVEKAKRLLKESGYKGELISYRIVRDYYLNSENAALMIIDMWRQIGIQAKLELVDNFKAARGKGVEIYAWSNTIRLPDPVGGLMVSWGPRSSIQTKYKFWTPTSKFNDFSNVILTSGDADQRYKAFQHALDIFESEMPGTILYNPLYTYGVKRGINWTPYSIYFMDFRPDVFSFQPRK